MTTEEKLERVSDNLDRLTTIVDTLAATVVAHDNQLDALLKIVEKHCAQIAAQGEQIAATERQWQAYINTLPRQ
jgi:ABC-type transporter Mla subunit MlaD